MAHTKITRLDAQGLAHIEERVEDQLLWHHTQTAPGLGVIGLHVMALNQGFACAGSTQPGQHTDERGFTGTIGAEQTKKLTGFDIQRNALERTHHTPR